MDPGIQPRRSPCERLSAVMLLRFVHSINLVPNLVLLPTLVLLWQQQGNPVTLVGPSGAYQASYICLLSSR